MLFKKKVKASLAAKIKSMVNGLSVEDFDITVYSHQCIAPTENTHKSGSIFLVRKTKLLNGKYQFKFRLPIGISEPCPRRVAFDSGIKEVVILNPTGEDESYIEVTLNEQECQDYIDTVVNAGAHAVQLEVSVISAYCTNQELIDMAKQFNELCAPSHVIATEFISHLYVSERILTAPFAGNNKPYSESDYKDFVEIIKDEVMKKIEFQNALTEIAF